MLERSPLAHSMLVATLHILTTGEIYRDPGGDDFAKRNPERQTRRLVAHLEKLGHVVTLGVGAWLPVRPWPRAYSGFNRALVFRGVGAGAR